MKWCEREDELKSVADLQAEEPAVEWKDQFRGNRITHRVYPHQYARVLVARGTWRHYGEW